MFHILQLLLLPRLSLSSSSTNENFETDVMDSKRMTNSNAISWIDREYNGPQGTGLKIKKTYIISCGPTCTINDRDSSLWKMDSFEEFQMPGKNDHNVHNINRQVIRVKQMKEILPFIFIKHELTILFFIS